MAFSSPASQPSAPPRSLVYPSAHPVGLSDPAHLIEPSDPAVLQSQAAVSAPEKKDENPFIDGVTLEPLGDAVISCKNQHVYNRSTISDLLTRGCKCPDCNDPLSFRDAKSFLPAVATKKAMEVWKEAQDKIDRLKKLEAQLEQFNKLKEENATLRRAFGNKGPSESKLGVKAEANTHAHTAIINQLALKIAEKRKELVILMYVKHVKANRLIRAMEGSDRKIDEGKRKKNEAKIQQILKAVDYKKPVSDGKSHYLTYRKDFKPDQKDTGLKAKVKKLREEIKGTNGYATQQIRGIAAEMQTLTQEIQQNPLQSEKPSTTLQEKIKTLTTVQAHYKQLSETQRRNLDKFRAEAKNLRDGLYKTTLTIKKVSEELQNLCIQQSREAKSLEQYQAQSLAHTPIWRNKRTHRFP